MTVRFRNQFQFEQTEIQFSFLGNGILQMERTSDNQYWVFDSDTLSWNRMDRSLLTVILERYLPNELNQAQKNRMLQQIISNIPPQRRRFNSSRGVIPISEKKNFNIVTREVIPRMAEDRWTFYLPVKYSPLLSLIIIKSYLDSLFDEDAQLILKQFLKARLSNSDQNFQLRMSGQADSGKSTLILLIEFVFQKFAFRINPNVRPPEGDYRQVRTINTDSYHHQDVRLFTLEEPDTRPQRDYYSRTPLLYYGTLQTADITIRPRFIRNRNFERGLITNDNRETFFNWIFF